MLAMLTDHQAITKAEFKRLCLGLGAEVSPPEAADIFEGIMDSSGCAPLLKVLGVLMAPEQAIKLSKQLERPTAGGAAGANRPSSSNCGSHMSKGSRGSRGRASTPQKELPWKQRQSLQLVPNSHRDFLMQTKPQMQLGLRAQTPPLISSRSRYSTASSAPSVTSSPQKTSRSAKQRAMQGKKWKWPSTLISEARGQHEVDRTPPPRDETCLLHERADSIKGFEHEWVWREANARKKETYCLLDMGIKGEYRDYMASKYGVTT